MTLIALTGIPGSGKSTICAILNSMGIRCINALDIPGSGRCMEGDEVDIDCLGDMWSSMVMENIVIDSHYSHLLGVKAVVILERGEEETMRTLKERGYSPEKISDNIESFLSDIIYRESLELLPSTKIHRVLNKHGKEEETAEEVMAIISRIFSSDIRS